MVESQLSPRSSQSKSGFLRPAVALLNRLRYAQKFALIGALVVVPLAAVTVLQIKATNDQAVFNRKEHWGMAYVDALRETFRATQRFGELQAQVLAGDGSVAEDFRLATTRVDEAMAAVGAAEKQYGAEFGTAEIFNGAKQEWDTLKGAQASPEAAAASREKLRGQLRNLVFQVGNGSNLTLDPDVDSYWLQDSVVGTLVNLTDLVHRTGTLGAAAAAKGSLTAADRVEMAGLYRSSQDQLRQIVDSNLKTSMVQNPSGTVRPALQEQVQRTDQVVGDYLKWLRDGYVMGSGTVTAADMRARSLAATEQLSLLQQKIMPVLDDLINVRVSRYVLYRNVGLVLALLAFGLLAYAFTGFYSSVRSSVESLDQATQRMIAGSEETFHVASRDELGQIGESYNAINKALIEARRLRGRVEAENQELQANILNLLGVVSDAADGNLTVRATVSAGAMGNVADAFNQMVESWQNVVGEIQKLFERTSAAVSGIQTSAQEMAQGAGQQVDEILGATASVSRVTEGIQKVSATAESASGAGRKTLESAQLGTASVLAVVRGMEGLRANVQAGAKKIKTLGDRSMEITSIVGTIAKISDQTNMLALNAAIEAARAGEHGRGFSVVADQVRQLAERTASATHEIESLVRAIQAETNESVDAIEQQTAVVEAESKVVSSAGEALARISEVSNQSASLIQEIDSVARQQVEGVVGVARIMEQVSFIARKTQSSADESVKSAAALAALSGQLRERVNQFRI